MNVLITGGAGYVGNELVYKLAQDPEVESILIYDNLSRKIYTIFFDTPIENTKVRFVRGELLDSRLIRSILPGIDVVYHLAAKVSTPFANEDSHLFEQINNWGTAELVYEVEESKVKHFIYISSTSVYDSSKKFIDIDSVPNPKTFYGNSKLRGESHVQRLMPKMKTHIIRCGNIYGYSPSLRFDAVINRFMFEANFYGRLSVQGNGNQHRAFIHIDKAVNVMSNLIHSDLNSGIYNLVDRNLSVLEITDHIKVLYPELETIFISQHLEMREMKVRPDERLEKICNHPHQSFTDELIAFKKKFAFTFEK
ncbi:MAG: SDR family oxidoreductase [Bacteroidota bacterium]